ncbi:MAG: polysaccharide deacetylase family protein [Xanthobacteraceae bacterium]
MQSRWRQAAISLLTLWAILNSPLAATASADRVLSFDHAATNQKIVALTFDADMTPGMLRELKSGKVSSWYNEKVIEALKQLQAPATLFLTGLWIETYPEATKQLATDPLFELGNHSYSHGAFHSPCYSLFPIPESKQAAEVQKTDDLLKQYAVSYKKYFRCPGLCSDAQAMKTVEEQGYTVIGGDVDGADAFEKSPKWVASDVVSHVHPGSIVVLHMHGGPNAPATAAALPDIITRLRAEGYTFVKVSDLLKLPAGEPIKRAPMVRQATSTSPAVTPAYFPLQHFFRR